MHSTHGLLALLLPPLLLLVATTGPARALDDEERHVMVKLHNLYRAQVSPSAANMLQMVSVARCTHLPGLKGSCTGPSADPSHPLAEAITGTHLSGQQQNL